MNKSIIQQQLYDILDIPIVLIDIIYLYARCYIEEYEKIIYCTINSKEILVIGKKLFVHDHSSYLVYDTDTYNLLEQNPYDRTKYYEYIHKHFKEVSKTNGSSWSGYYPYDDEFYKLSNLWCNHTNTLIAYTNIYIIKCSSDYSINIYNKFTDALIHTISGPEIDSEYQIIYKNIISYNNILYATINLRSVLRRVTSSCILMYDLQSFKLIKKIRRKERSSYISQSDGDARYLAFSNNKMFIGLDTGGIEVWTIGESL
jgi:hypothetical protein